MPPVVKTVRRLVPPFTDLSKLDVCGLVYKSAQGIITEIKSWRKGHIVRNTQYIAPDGTSCIDDSAASNWLLFKIDIT
jgi:hypothetical protein